MGEANPIPFFPSPTLFVVDPLFGSGRVPFLCFGSAVFPHLSTRSFTQIYCPFKCSCAVTIWWMSLLKVEAPVTVLCHAVVTVLCHAMARLSMVSAHLSSSSAELAFGLDTGWICLMFGWLFAVVSQSSQFALFTRLWCYFARLVVIFWHMSSAEGSCSSFFIFRFSYCHLISYASRSKFTQPLNGSTISSSHLHEVAYGYKFKVQVTFPHDYGSSSSMGFAPPILYRSRPCSCSVFWFSVTTWQPFFFRFGGRIGVVLWDLLPGCWVSSGLWFGISLASGHHSFHLYMLLYLRLLFDGFMGQRRRRRRWQRWLLGFP